jgi:hypothetical protein
MDGPAAQELQEKYGLAGIRFSNDVAPGWQPYFLRMIDVALTDLARVLPALDLSGLQIAFTGKHGYRAALAVHEPRRRRIVLPPATGAGALAHEIAHDLDWQVAFGRYGIRGDYASDAIGRQATDPVAGRIRDLTAASMNPSSGIDAAHAHSSRPAEIFARSVDWFIALALAEQGRSNGYLTSIQDEILTGYGSARPPEASGTAGEALIALLDELSPVSSPSREAWRSRYGRTSPASSLTTRQAAAAAAGSPAADFHPQSR